MKAAVYYGPGDIRVEDRPEPDATKDNLVVQVHCCAICGTDLKLATIGHHRCQPQRIIGHEMIGHIVHVGDDVNGFAEGQRITLATTVACGEEDCPYCARGLGNLCPDSLPLGLGGDGAFAEFMAIPPRAVAGGNAVKVPEEVPDEAAALCEPMSCAINAQQIAGVGEGGSVLVIGGGPLGTIHAEVAKALGARRVMISELSELRLSMLRELEDVLIIDSANEDVGEVVAQNTDGLGVDVAVVAAPARAAHEVSINYVRKGGAVSLFASLSSDAPDITFNSRVIHYGELRVCGASDSRPEHVQKAVELLAAGKIDHQKIITHRVSLENIHQGLQLMKERQSLKVLVFPPGRQP